MQELTRKESGTRFAVLIFNGNQWETYDSVLNKSTTNTSPSLIFRRGTSSRLSPQSLLSSVIVVFQWITTPEMLLFPKLIPQWWKITVTSTNASLPDLTALSIPQYPQHAHIHYSREEHEFLSIFRYLTLSISDGAWLQSPNNIF